MKRSIAILALSLVLPGAASAQSLFGTQGLGSPLPGVDARARGMSVSGVGLMGLSTSLINPAEAGGILRRGFTASFQPWGASAELNGEEDDVSGTRFPMMALFYPIRRFTFTLGYSGLYDQSWAIIAQGAQDIGGQMVQFDDVVRSAGGINEFKLGAAYYVNERLSIGASLGLNTGFVQRNTTRQFPDTALDLLSFERTARWQYSGPAASIGLRWDPIHAVRVGASVAWSGDLEAEPDSATSAGMHEYQMPLRLAVGASASLSPRLTLAASATHFAFGSGSYAAPGTSTQTVADAVTEFGAGLEWSEIRTATRVFPLRLGYRMTKLPFHKTNESAADEWSVSGGLGLQLVQDDFGPLAVADIGFERGSRSGWETNASPDGLSEKFWRATVSISLFGR